MKQQRHLYILIFAAVVVQAIFSCQRHSNAGVTGANGDSINWDDSAHVLIAKACEYFNNNQDDSVEMLVSTIREFCKEHDLKERYYKAWAIPIEMYFWTNQFDKGVKEAQKMQEEALKEQYDYGLFEANRLLGNGYLVDGKSDEGVKHLKKALSYVSPDEVISNVPRIYDKLVSGLQDLKLYEEEDSVFKEWKSTLDRYYAKIGKSNEEIFSDWYLIYQNSLADYLMKMGKLDAAALAVDSVEYYGKKNEPVDPLTNNLIVDSKSNLAYEQGDYAKALFWADQKQAIGKEINDKSIFVGALGLKSKTLEKMGRYKEALDVFRQEKTFMDSVTMIDNHEQLNELNKRFEVNELKMEKERQQMQAERRQLYLVIAIVVIIMIAVIVFAYFRRRADRRLAAIKAAKERIENELKIARDIQMSMVPSQFPDYEGLDMFASMAPAKEVGGDLYGYVLLGDKLYFALGDVSGKGVPASLFMAQATRLFRTLAAQQMKPAEICTRMNDALSGEDNESSMFVTFFLGLVDLTTGHLDFCNAGHNPPVIGGGESHGEFLEMLPNMPIGLWPGLEYEGEEIENIKGRPLFIYTDGLNEAEDIEQQQFGDDRLLEILRSRHFDSAKQVIEVLTAEVEAHRRGAEPNDDLTMMCIRID